LPPGGAPNEVVSSGFFSRLERSASPRGEALRSSLLKKPLDTTSFGAPPGGKPGLPPQRFR